MTNTTYFISGGNRGIGFNLVKQLSDKKDVTIIATARNPDKADDLNALAKEKGNIKVIQLDVASKESVFDLPNKLANIADSIDVLISNAGISDAYYKVLDAPEDVWLSHYTTNVLGPIFLYQALFPLLSKGTKKQIIFISSVAGSIGGFFPASISAYGQSKAALNYTSKEISYELESEGFTVVAIHPGMVSTDMGRYGVKSIVNIHPHLKETAESMTITPETSAQKLIAVFDKLTKDDNGKFLTYEDGSEIPW